MTTDLDSRDQGAVRYFAEDRSAELAVGYLQHVRDEVRASLYAVAARHLLRVMDPAPTDLLRPARLGQWVTLPPGAPPATALLEAAHAAADARVYQSRAQGHAAAPTALHPLLPAGPHSGAPNLSTPSPDPGLGR